MKNQEKICAIPRNVCVFQLKIDHLCIPKQSFAVFILCKCLLNQKTFLFFLKIELSQVFKVKLVKLNVKESINNR